MQAWQTISLDPNTPEVLEFRRTILNKAKQKKLIADRVSYLCELSKNKEILDIGCVEHTINSSDNSQWLHGKLKKEAKSCIGVDILEQEVKLLQAKGYDIRVHDVTKEPLKQKFDLIICGEVLEHLNTPGDLVKNAAKMLRDSGKLVISIPNPWYMNVIFKNIFNENLYLDNADHVSWFDPYTLCELGQRHGLVLDSFAGVAVNSKTNLRTSIFFGLRPILTMLGVQPNIFAKTIIYEFVRAEMK